MRGNIKGVGREEEEKISKAKDGERREREKGKGPME